LLFKYLDYSPPPPIASSIWGTKGIKYTLDYLVFPPGKINVTVIN